MKKEQKKKGKWQQWIVMGFFMLIGAVCGVLMVSYTEQRGTENSSELEDLIFFGVLFIGMYIGIFLQLTIHEAGHLAFGLKSGYQFSSFRIGSFMWLKENGKIVSRKLSLAGTGGQCLMVPPQMQDGKIPVILYNLGGCIMNLVASAVFLVIYLLIPKGTVISLFCLMMVLIGVAIALMNGIPLRLGTVDNDGYNALSLGKNPDAMRAFWLQLKVNEQIAKGIRLKDMPDEWFAVPDDEAMQNSMVATQGVFATNRLMDQQRFEDADRLIAHLLEIDSGIIGLHRNLMICDRMYCELIQDNRKEILEEMLTKEQIKFMRAMKKFPSVVRTEYAYALLALKDTAKANATRDIFEKVAKTYPYPSDVRSERELMKIADSVANSAVQENAVTPCSETSTS